MRDLFQEVKEGFDELHRRRSISVDQIKEALSNIWIVTDDGKVAAPFTVSNVVRFLNELNRGIENGKV